MKSSLIFLFNNLNNPIIINNNNGNNKILIARMTARTVRSVLKTHQSQWRIYRNVSLPLAYFFTPIFIFECIFIYAYLKLK
jgi:hypothetical protein